MTFGQADPIRDAIHFPPSSGEPYELPGSIYRPLDSLSLRPLLSSSINIVPVAKFLSESNNIVSAFRGSMESFGYPAIRRSGDSGSGSQV